MNDFMHYIDQTYGQELVGTFAEKVGRANDEVAELKQAIALADEDKAIVAALRVRRAVEIVERAAVAIGVGQTDQHQVAAAALHRLQVAAHPLLERVPIELPGLVATWRYLARFNVANLDHLRGGDGLVDATRREIADVCLERVDLRHARLAGSTLRDVQAQGGMLDAIDAEGATLLRVQATDAAMRGADLSCCLAEHSDFSRADLQRSNWRDASVFWSFFSGAVLIDMLCDDALFVDCDLRGADLRVLNLGPRATSIGARFIRCDLRETCWEQRDLGGVTFIDCRMHGVMGQALATHADIVRPDLSARGDGSGIATARDVINMWERP